jgi:predicted ATP-grasp superfamily ATP-dependent carboligase
MKRGRARVAERRALVLENGLGCVLPAARSLARAGWTVGLGAPFENPRERGSRAVTHRHQIPRPEDTVDGFLDAINDAVAAVGYDVVLPADDASVLALSVHRDRVRAIVPYPPHESVLRAIDKLELTRAAEAEGVAVPRTEVATAAAIEACELPVMIKPRLQWTPGSDADVGELFIERAEDRDGVRRRVAEIERAGGAAVLQEPVAGRQVALSVVVDRDGRVVAASQQETLLYSLAQTSTRAVTLEVDETLVDGISRLLRRLGWWGLANLQFLEHERDVTPLLIDLNGRFYGSVALAIAAGADLPAIWADCAMGTPPAERATARAGVRFHALESDLVRARRQHDPGLLRDVARTFSFAPGAAHTLWSIHDPVPALRWGVRLAGRLAGRLVRPRA